MWLVLIHNIKNLLLDSDSKSFLLIMFLEYPDKNNFLNENNDSIF